MAANVSAITKQKTIEDIASWVVFYKILFSESPFKGSNNPLRSCGGRKVDQLIKARFNYVIVQMHINL